jgi:conjugative transfer ATPase
MSAMNRRVQGIKEILLKPHLRGRNCRAPDGIDKRVSHLQKGDDEPSGARQDDDNALRSCCEDFASPPHNRLGLMFGRPSHATHADEKALYAHHPSFADMLPWVDYLPESRCFLLEDNRSVGAAFELTPIGVEGRESDYLIAARDEVMNALQDSFEESEDAPWVVQFFCSDDTDFAPYVNHLHDYIKERGGINPFSSHYIETMSSHLGAIAKKDGLFTDTVVTKEVWRGQNRRTRMVIYRRIPAGKKMNVSPEEALTQVCDRIEAAFRRLKIRRLSAKEYYEWLLLWFNPPFRDDPEKLRLYPYWDVREDNNKGNADHAENAKDPDNRDDTIALPPLPYSHRFSEKLLTAAPRSDAKRGVWYFNDQPHEVVVVDKLRKKPLIGHTTGEVLRGDARAALLDRLPSGTVMSLTMVVKPQDILEAKMTQLQKKAIGENLASLQVKEDVETARHYMRTDHKMYRASLAFYLSAENDEALHKKHIDLETALLSADLEPTPEGEEIAGCNAYLRGLPMNFNPLLDPKDWYTKYQFVQHTANLASVWGRNTGSGNPGLTFFNRGGQPLTFDPLNRADRAMNGHMLIFGPTGAGKSATLTSMMIQMAAVYRPRMFVVEAGNSFGLTAQYFKHHGMTVNQVKIAPGSGISLAPFVDAHLLIDAPEKILPPKIAESELEELTQEKINEVAGKAKATVEQGDFVSSSPDDPEKRDVMGELEIIALLMITGGEEKETERFTRADRSTVRRAILRAAQTCVADGRPVLVEDIVAALNAESQEPEIKPNRAERIVELAQAMSAYTMGLEGEMFNRPGTNWRECDVTHVDLGFFARGGKESEMAIVYISLVNIVNNIAERDQYKGRPILMITDEAHLITKNPLVAPYVVKITKMWRKLYALYWMATQNLADFPGAAKTLLNMIEWWVCLCMPAEEVEEIARFKNLTQAQKTMLLSARKENRKYTEGVVLSKNFEMLIRMSPPSLHLALAMTEPEEKNERLKIMREKDCDELTAIYYVADRLDRSRGIIPKPEGDACGVRH